MLFAALAVGRGRVLGRRRPELRRFSPRRCGHGGLHAERAHARRGRRRSRGKEARGGGGGGGGGEQAAAAARVRAGCECAGPAAPFLRGPAGTAGRGGTAACPGAGRGKRRLHFRVENVPFLRRRSWKRRDRN